MRAPTHTLTHSLSHKGNKEERESKEAKTFLGNVNIVWSNGQNVEAKIKANGAGPQTKAQEPEDDLPF